MERERQGVANSPYWATITSMHERLCQDLQDLRDTALALDTLALDTDIIDDCFIKPEIALKYAFLQPLDDPLEKTFDRNNLLSYFDLPSSQKIVSDEHGEFYDKHSGPFSFHTKSQLDLCSLFEEKHEKKPVEVIKPPVSAAPPAVAAAPKSELEISHSKVLSQLKSALKVESEGESRDRNEEFSLKPSKVIEEIGSGAGGFISKLIGNKKGKAGTIEEREQLVSSGKKCQIVASSDNYFKTNFHSDGPKIPTSPPIDSKNVSNNRTMSAYRSVSGMEESAALLGTQDSLAASTDSEFLSCEDLNAIPTPSSPSTSIMPKTGLDFLDNW